MRYNCSVLFCSFIQLAEDYFNGITIGERSGQVYAYIADWSGGILALNVTPTFNTSSQSLVFQSDLLAHIPSTGNVYISIYQNLYLSIERNRIFHLNNHPPIYYIAPVYSSKLLRNGELLAAIADDDGVYLVDIVDPSNPIVLERFVFEGGK